MKITIDAAVVQQALDAPCLYHYTGNILDSDKCVIHRSHMYNAIEQAEGQEPVVECDCATKISPDGSKLTFCGSSQMRRATKAGHAFSVGNEKPVGYLAHRNGNPSWDEDCVCKDPVYPVDETDDRESVAIYTHPAPAQRALNPLTGEKLRDIARSFKGNTQRRLSDHWDEIVDFAREVEAAHSIKDQS